MLKLTERTCTTCKNTKPIEEFPWKIQKTGIRQHLCAPCRRQRSKEWYQKYKDRIKPKMIAESKVRRTKVINKVYEFLKMHPCIDCGEINPLKLEFDHLGPKSDNVSTLIAQGCNWQKIKTEMDKCVVRCANCHRFKTAKDFNWGMYTMWIEDQK